MFEKIEVNGPGTHPLFQHLKSGARGVLGSEGIKWNFTKFLIGRTGTVIERFAPMTTPVSIEAAIEAALG
jgi:glutathione peroxidase